MSATFWGFLQAWKKQFVRKKWGFLLFFIIDIPPADLQSKEGLA